MLAIRGELLKKYPNTVVYAHAAEWAMRDGHVDPSRERTLAELGAGELDKPPRSKIRTPLYEAKVVLDALPEDRWQPSTWREYGDVVLRTQFAAVRVHWATGGAPLSRV